MRILPIGPALQSPVVRRGVKGGGWGCLASEWERPLWCVKFFSCAGQKDILPCGLELHSRKLQTDFHTFAEGAFSCTRAVLKSLAEAFNKALIYIFFL